MKTLHYAAAAAALLCSMTANAEGYQINSLSAKQIGMGHTGIALKLGAENMFFNPAGMAYMDKTLDMSASGTFIMPTSTATDLNTDREWTTDNGVSTPINVNAAFSIYDNLKAGITFYTPYGSSINWTDDWAGSVFNQNVSLKMYTVQPTVSWAINEKFSIGAGLMLSWATVDLNKGLISAASLDKVIRAKNLTEGTNIPECGDVTPASVNLNGKTGIAAGVNVGVMYNATRDLTFGASFRSQMTMKVKSGEATVRYNSAFAEGMLGDVLGSIHHANFRAQMPAAWVLGVGASYKGIDRLTLALDARLTGWHAYKSLDVEFLAESLQDMNQYIPKRYKNSWCFSAGAQYAVTQRLDARLGMMIDTTPVRLDYYNPETPGMTKIEPTIGISFRPLPNLSIDLGFMYVQGCGKKNASVTAPNLLYKGMLAQGMKEGMQAGAAAGLTGEALAAAAAQGATVAAQKAAAMGVEPNETFRANYKLHAFIPSIGVSYSF